MSTTIENLQKRGYLDTSFLPPSLSNSKLLELLQLDIPQERTASAYLLGKRKDIDESSLAKALLKALQLEKSLYTKIELCKTLEKGTSTTVVEMLPCLGKIGTNQQHQLPDKVSKKRSYPLPRDIIARTIGHMNPEILPTLLRSLETLSITQTRKLIDGIGFLCFYNEYIDNLTFLNQLINHYNTHTKDELTRWKITLALSAFHTEKAKKQLKSIAENEKEILIKNEAKHSLAIKDMRGLKTTTFVKSSDEGTSLGEFK